MAYYHVHGLIPDNLSQKKGYKLFEEYIKSGAPKDNFDGFAIISRVHAPQTGEVFVTCIADNHIKVDEHFAIWREKFGIEWHKSGMDEVGYSRRLARNIITVNERYFRPAEVERLLGDATKAKKVLGWEPKTSFDQLVKEMCENES